jgi:hypothetical protein
MKTTLKAKFTTSSGMFFHGLLMNSSTGVVIFKLVLYVQVCQSCMVPGNYQLSLVQKATDMVIEGTSGSQACKARTCKLQYLDSQ